MLTVVALGPLVFASPALAAPGDLDTTFGDDGTVVTGFGTFSPGEDLVIQSDGKVVVAGGEFLARYNPDGSLDPSFDGDGKAVGSGGGGDIAMQPDGKIVVAGQFSSENSSGQLDFDFQVLRYNADGSSDTTFDGDGRLTTPVGPGNAFDSAHGVGVQPDGKIVVVGYSHDYGTNNRDLALVRYNPDGSLDTTFDTDGKLTTDIGSGQDAATDIALRPDGKIVVGGFSGHTENTGGITIDDDFVAARYNADGSLDTTFDGDGKLTTSFGSGADQARTLALQPNGKIVLAGVSQHASESSGNFINDFAVARYNADGSLDTTFDTDGKLTTAIGSHNDEVTDLVLQGDGKIVAVGRTTVDRDGLNRNWEIILARYNPDGSLDPLFGGDGKASGPEINQQNVAAALQADGKILVSSTSTNQGQLLARFYGGEDVTPTGPVAGLTASVQAHDASLSWANPTDGEFAATRVVRSTTGFATEAIGGADQTRVYEGTATSRTDANLPEDRYYYTAFAKDNNGNYSAAAKVMAVVDLAPPDTQVLSGPLGDTNDSKPTFTFDAWDNLSPQADLLYSYRVDGESWSDYSGATSATVGGIAGLPDGSHTFYVRAKDEAGNVDGSPAERAFTVDTQGPEVTITAGPSGTVSVGTARFGFSAAEAAVDFQCKLDDAPDFAPCFSPENYSGLSNGEHTFRVQGVDVLGNVGPVESRTWTIAPETTSQEVAAGGTVNTDLENDGATASDPVETQITSPFAGTVSVEESVVVTQSSAGYSLLGQQVNIEAPDATAANPLRFVFVFDSSLIPAGEDKDTIQIFRNGVPLEACADQSGTATPDPCVLGKEPLADGDVRFTVLTSHASAWNFGVATDSPPPADTTKPTITPVSPRHASITRDTTPLIRATVKDNNSLAKANVKLYVGGRLISGAKYSYAPSTGALVHNSPTLAKGKKTVKIVATDAAGNVSIKSWYFTIK